MAGLRIHCLNMRLLSTHTCGVGGAKTKMNANKVASKSTIRLATSWLRWFLCLVPSHLG